MASLDEVFENATANGSILGAVILGRDTSGKFNYSKTFGRRTFGDGEESLMRTDTVLSFASATKLITCIAVMQLVEAGKLNLDDDMSPIIPELAEQEVLLGFDETTGEPQLRKRTNPLKLRYLLTHSAGLAYGAMNPLLQRWGALNNRAPQSGPTVVERFAYPLAYEPGTGWGYSPGVDWAGKIVERVTGETLESYFRKHIFDPLDITSITFWPRKHPSIQGKLATMTARTASGGIEPYKGPYITDGAEDCFGGQGASGNLEDYMKILTSLLVNDGKLLRKETADQFFQPQLTAESKVAQKALIQDPEKVKIFVGDFPSDMEYDWGLGGILVQSDGRTRRSKGTMIWSGMPNLFWFIDRARGLCAVIGMQLLPPADPKAQELVRLFEEGMYELLGSQVV
ncbi:acyltransferase LovD [Aspergillus lentulus]|uniref:Acyltransferase LovD n=1 Tax=Aspergillus lentulus TaxID=293939 RepID=A0AAN4TEJ7_ASPLE|nr:acyltransferase LovD [Aspergillus lentulus]